MTKKISKATLLKQRQKNRDYHNEYMKKARRQGRYQKPKDWVQETTKEGIHLKFDCRWLHKLLTKNQNLRTEENQRFRKELNDKDKAICKTIELQKKLITKMYKEKVELEKRVQQTIN